MTYPSYRIKAADEDEFVGKVKGLERYTPQDDCPTLVSELIRCPVCMLMDS